MASFNLAGIDVSKYQGNVDWDKVKNTGIDFVIIRAGYGKYSNQKDPKFDTNIKGAYEAGIRNIGVYHFSYADNVADAKIEAQVCLKWVEPYKKMITLPIWFDQEYTQDILNATKTVRTNCCIEFCKAIHNAGYRTGLYASKDWFENKITASSLPSYCENWVAQYASACTYKGDYVVWQYSSTGKVNGIQGNVDMNKAKASLIKASASQEGWVKSGSNWYWYEKGKAVTNCWRKITGGSGVAYWYYLGPGGKMLKGMQQIQGKIYYLNPTAALGVPEGALIMTDENGVVNRG